MSYHIYNIIATDAEHNGMPLFLTADTYEEAVSKWADVVSTNTVGDFEYFYHRIDLLEIDEDNDGNFTADIIRQRIISDDRESGKTKIKLFAVKEY